MKCRGFKGKFYSLARFEASAASWLFSVLMILVCGALVIMETHGYQIGWHG
jgi:hypothetical protein